ncbi:hypothetical protein [Limnobacter alexandrii]|uniref:hypothetical protein n=1 Tax=Limnobacter alexandrii TaxID=2570352 RepID=UPI0011092CDD|nr:hypothetical protein [Limnobacter alexandrii]
MNDSEKYLALLDLMEKQNIRLLAQVSALQVLTTFIAMQVPRLNAVIAGLQIHLESIEEDDSKADYAASLRALIDTLNAGAQDGNHDT